MPNNPRHREAVQVMPIVVMALIVLLMVGLLWLIDRNEREEERLNLIKDVLWVEQSLRFQMSSDEDKLRQLAAEVGEGPGAFAVRARQLMTADPAIEKIVWRRPDGGPLAAVPGLSAIDEAGQLALDESRAAAVTLAQSLQRRAYSDVFQADGRYVFEMAVPAFRHGEPAGVVVATYGLEPLLLHGVPWWFTQKYRLAVVDTNGTSLAAKSNVELAEAGPSYQVTFDPPGHGLSLQVTAYRAETNLGRNVLVAAILILAVLALGSLWALRRHVRRRIAAERAVREQHAFRKAMEDSLTVGMRARDLEGRVTYVNPAFCRMVGFEADELIGSMPPYPYWIPEDADTNLALHRAVLAGQAPADGFEIRFRRKDDTRFQALIYEAPLIDANGKHAGWMASVVDITERKRGEERWRQQQEMLQHTSRLITMGEMASTLAHEINQPLSAIASYSTGCINKLQSGVYTPEQLLEVMGKLSVQANRAGQIIRRIYDFVRKRDPVVAPRRLSDIVDNSLAFLAAEAKKRGVRIDCQPVGNDIQINADGILVEQVLLNIARNGIEAMGTTPATERVLTLRFGVADGMVSVSIADRGTGIPPDIAQGLFTPFFTTKEHGMGMGLNICRSIIELHQGRLWYEDNPGGGSVFTFTLPAAGSDLKGAA